MVGKKENPGKEEDEKSSKRKIRDSRVESKRFHTQERGIGIKEVQDVSLEEWHQEG